MKVLSSIYDISGYGIKGAMAAPSLLFVLLLACVLSTTPFLRTSSQQQQPPPPKSSKPASPFASFFDLRTSRSLLYSLLHRIVNHRVARGDSAGAERVRHIIASVESGISFWNNAGTLGWDYLVNYSWRRLDPNKIFGILRLVNQLQSALAELLQLPSDSDRLQWLSANYSRIFQITKSLLQNLLDLFDHPGALQNFMLSIQTELISGDILRDALQLGAADFQGLVRVAKEMLERYYGAANDRMHSDL